MPLPSVRVGTSVVLCNWWLLPFQLYGDKYRCTVCSLYQFLVIISPRSGFEELYGDKYHVDVLDIWTHHTPYPFNQVGGPSRHCPWDVLKLAHP